MVELVEELEKLDATPAIQEMISEAKAGEYHDYKNNKYACGKVAVVGKLRSAGLDDLANRVINGEFDEVPDEEDEKMLAGLMKEMFKKPEPKPKTSVCPRIRGKAIPNGSAWGFEIYITIGADGPENPPMVLESNQDFINRETALIEMKKMVPGLMNVISEAVGVKPEGYIDLIKNEFTTKL